jgi:hypothetical protein
MSEQGLSWRDARLAIPPTRAQALASDGALMTPLEWLLVALIDAAIFRRFEAEYIERGFWAHWTVFNNWRYSQERAAWLAKDVPI